MKQPRDLTGQTFGRLIALNRVPVKGDSKWVCRCSCGTIKTISGADLVSGHTKSCGCYFKEILSKSNLKHGERRRGKTTKEYRTWIGINCRCRNKNDARYKDYGERGITVCDRWRHSFENFLEDMGRCPDGLSIDRKDVNGNYEPSNCRWATNEQQANNTRANIKLSFNGETLSVSQWARKLGYDHTAFHRAVRDKGITIREMARRALINKIFGITVKFTKTNRPVESAI